MNKPDHGKPTFAAQLGLPTTEEWHCQYFKERGLDISWAVVDYPPESLGFRFITHDPAGTPHPELSATRVHNGNPEVQASKGHTKHSLLLTSVVVG